jgi:hypothetical protein
MENQVEQCKKLLKVLRALVEQNGENEIFYL